MKSPFSLALTVKVQQPFGLALIARATSRPGILLILGPFHFLLEVGK